MTDDTDPAAAADTSFAATQVAPYVFVLSLYCFLLEFLVLVSMVDTISLFFLGTICLSTLLVSMISFLIVYIVTIYQLFIQIKLYDNLLICSIFH
jgi:hypothetical protein